MSILSKIESEVAALPPNLRAEVLDFVQFVKQRHGLPSSPASPASSASSASTLPAAAPDAGDSPLYQALTASGFVGCIESTEQLATHYKSALDFSAKGGSRS